MVSIQYNTNEILQKDSLMYSLDKDSCSRLDLSMFAQQGVYAYVFTYSYG